MTVRTLLKLAFSLALSLVVLWPARAGAQSIIKEPGNHPTYAVEIEPHFVFQWSNRLGADDGFGPGVRVNIPFLHNGPIPRINNNMAIGVGLDVTFGTGGRGWCYGAYNPNAWGTDCHVTEFWLPVTLQWNFFLTKVISVFGEPGFAIAHRSWNGPINCNGNNGPLCDHDYSTNDFEFVFWGGARFMFSDRVGATVRIGTPSLTAGINILL
jgi:hypothetical protein